MLLLIANGAPIVARLLPGLRRWNRPLDAGYLMADGRRLFGEHKTWRGLVAALLLTTPGAVVLGLPWWLGALFAALSMAGDLLASFIKRRRQLAPGAAAPGLDQLPEALLPLLFLAGPLQLGWHEIALISVLFVILDLLISRLFYFLGVRRHPW
jgi:CDP-2,3-bis-(O-geranylgeranyl)-sn-glycerol synthase